MTKGKKKLFSVILTIVLAVASLQTYSVTAYATADSSEASTSENTDNSENIDNIISFLKDMKGNIIEIELLKGHDLGRNKYLSLGYKQPVYKDVNDEQLEIFKNKVKQTGHIVKICKV